MASIYGVELKNVKTWLGQEGYGLQASVYIDKKKVGLVTDDAYGGPLRFDFDTTELDKRAEKYRTEIWNKDLKNADYINLYEGNSFDFNEVFIDDIYNLVESQKKWKKAQKTDFKQLVYYKTSENGVEYETCCSDISDEILIRALAKQSKCEASDIIIVKRYKDETDFVIA